ncbi:YidC/Oxa1 family membrane protein insertase [Patescibacteria group bacterium]
MLGNLYHIIFYKPLYNGLVFLADVLPFNDLGFAIIILTVVVRFVILPLSHKSIVTQKKIKILEPEIKKIKEKLKDKKEEQTKQIMELYRQHGISPFSGFFMILIQFPVFIALFMILRDATSLNSEILYSFVSMPENINTLFLGFVDITKSSYIVSFLAGFSQFFQIKLAMPAIPKKTPGKQSFGSELQRSMGIQMKYIMPIFIFFVAQKFSSGLALYWTTSNIFAIFHEIIVSRKSKEISATRD